MFTRAHRRSGRVTQRCHNSPRWETGLRTGSARRIWGIWRKWVELRLDTGREGLTFACSRRPWAGVARDGGGRWKSQNRKIVPLSPYVEKPLNLKVIKVSYLNWEVVNVFRISRFLGSIFMDIRCTFHT